MFSDMANLKEIKDLSYFKAKEVIYMNDMFSNSKLLRKLDLSSFEGKKVIDISSMFFCCENLEEIDMENFKIEHENIKSCNLFFKCEKLGKVIIDKNEELIKNELKSDRFKSVDNITYIRNVKTK